MSTTVVKTLYVGALTVATGVVVLWKFAKGEPAEPPMAWLYFLAALEGIASAHFAAKRFSYKGKDK